MCPPPSRSAGAQSVWPLLAAYCVLALLLISQISDAFIANRDDSVSSRWDTASRYSNWRLTSDALLGEEISSSFWGPKGLPPSSGDCLLLEAGLSVAAVGMDCNVTKPFLCEINRTTVLMSK